MSDIEFPIDSGLTRRIKGGRGLESTWGMEGKNNHEYFEKRTRDHELHLVTRFRSQGWDHQNGRRLDDCHIFSALQHYGAATRFIDFTTNVFIALWFAAAFSVEKYGTCGFLLGINTIGQLEYP